MRTESKELVREYREKLKQGASRESIVIDLHNQGINILDSMKVVREIYGISLGQAKSFVTKQPIWSELVKNTEPLHDEFENVFHNQS